MIIMIYVLQTLITIILMYHVYLGYNLFIIALIQIIITFLLALAIRYNKSNF